MEKKSRRLRNQFLRIYLLLTTPRWSTKFCLCSPSCQSSCPSNSLSRTSKA
jgi:nitrate reductase beta subunit